MVRGVLGPRVAVCGADAIDRSVFGLRMGDPLRSEVGRCWMMVHRGKHLIAGHRFWVRGFWEPGLLPADLRIGHTNGEIQNAANPTGEIPTGEIQNEGHPIDGGLHLGAAPIGVHLGDASEGRDRCLRGFCDGFPYSPQRGWQSHRTRWELS